MYLRTCGILENQIDITDGAKRAMEQVDGMFSRMCKKTKSNQNVWVAYFLNDESHELCKGYLTTLLAYKHIEAMSKFPDYNMIVVAQNKHMLIFDAVLDRNPKRI